MRIHTEILRSSHVSGSIAFRRFVLYGIYFLMSVSEVKRLLRVRRCQGTGVFELMPSPVGHGCQRHTCLIIKRERLETSDVDRRGEVAVAYRQRSQWVGLGNDRVVACDHSLTVDIGSRVLSVVS